VVTAGTGGTGGNRQFSIVPYYYDPKILHIILSCLFLPVPNPPAQYPPALAGRRLPVPLLFHACSDLFRSRTYPVGSSWRAGMIPSLLQHPRTGQGGMCDKDCRTSETAMKGKRGTR